MYCRVLSATFSGLEVVPVYVEADVSDGMPSFTMVGYASTQVKEAQDRVRTSLRNLGITLPPKRITINLSPADLRKEGSRFDLPIAAAVLMALGRIPPHSLEKSMVLGELGLDGHVERITGVLPAAAAARELGCQTCIVPAENTGEGENVSKIRIIGLSHVRELLFFCCSGEVPEQKGVPEKKTVDAKEGGASSLPEKTGKEREPDFLDVSGQRAAKRAALIAAAGFHNLLMLGPPGSGKSMIARRIPTILPELTREEQLEITRIYSIAGLLPRGTSLMKKRPFRSPHHTIPPGALAGGGRNPVPGEITLAHLGVLFMDELPEASRKTIEVLRQPLEEHRIVISRVSGSYVFPASFLMVAAMNPCPCGYYPDRNRCTCTPAEISRYLERVSQPILDRIDLCVQVEPVAYQDLKEGTKGNESSADLRKKVCFAAKIQKERYQKENIRWNSELSAGQLSRYCPLSPEAEMLLEKAFEKLGFSARAYHGIIKTARTIADLEGTSVIQEEHVSEAICYRSADKKIWRV